MLLALEMSLFARELSKAGHSARSSRMVEARASASTYRGCGGNTEAAPESRIRHHCFEGINYVPKY